MKQKKIYKAICVAAIIIGILLIADGMNGRFENNKLYDKKTITVEDVEKPTSAIFISRVETSPPNDDYLVKSKFVAFSGIEHLQTMELGKNEGIDATCSMGNAKILVLDEFGEQHFYHSISEMYYEPGPAGIYDVYIVGKWFTGTVTVKNGSRE